MLSPPDPHHYTTPHAVASDGPLPWPLKAISILFLLAVLAVPLLIVGILVGAWLGLIQIAGPGGD
jgi:hypothetical protein